MCRAISSCRWAPSPRTSASGSCPAEPWTARRPPPQGAARELSEELGVNQAYLDTLKLTGSHVFEGSGGWTYTNLAAEGEMFSPKIDGYETVDAKWFTLPELAELANEGRLHPAFKNALPDVLALYDQPGTAVSTAADAAPKTAVADGHTQTAAADGPTNTVTTDGHTNTAAVDGHTKAGGQAGKVTSDPVGAVPDGKTGHPSLFLATGSYTPTSGSVHVTPPVDFGATPPGHVRAALPDGSVLPLKGLSAEASKAFGETLRSWGSGLFYVGPPPPRHAGRAVRCAPGRHVVR
ncbi:NUDIX hydrolase [Streptosporangium sp. NPDC048047]|uniref:NUDIX hydrolase n=1 Tax=Streptosporangium sp. NPDC048047 TaxID=3155748 RepID=UPI00344923FE